MLFEMRVLLRLAKTFLGGGRGDAASVYTAFGQFPFFGERTRYLNLGYWAGAQNHDDAGDALAEQLGLAAGMSEGDTVLDAGFGFGDQDAYWLGRFRPARIVGLNITALHVETARRRFPDPRLEFRLGSATAMDLPDASVDRVTALECAFHFVTRDDFFREAFRVLRPGGCCATADILPLPGRHSLPARLLTAGAQPFWQIPRENWYGIPEYRRRLEAAGFVDVRVHSIRDSVYVPFWRASQSYVRSPAGRSRFRLPMRVALRVPPRWVADGLDYVLASARKPA